MELALTKGDDEVSDDGALVSVLLAEDTTTVFVACDTACAFCTARVLELATELEDEAVMTNGNEYWKVSGLESRESLNP